MVHRALFGSVERFFGVLVEHYAGAFPLWLAPVQVAVLPITDRINEYASNVAAALAEAGFRVEANTRSDKIGAKIRDAQMQRVPYMLILGDQELEAGNVAVRHRREGDLGAMSLEEFLSKVVSERDTRSL
jgi:threonyl-tRNA synthetase